ncbi:MAG: xanthine dehydrogenase family protein molybdopterin-binding subunit [Dehalococcoidia bacterium]|nr:xanthine dehydrogenase family protein molybdopterin-binding subunit [Dehalococcoidia bacterium]
MVATPEKQTPANKQYRVIGTRPLRPDGTDKVTGRAAYGADVKLEGLLYGQVLRSPHAHARIKSINTKKAEALPGVKAVVTAQDFPPPPPGSINLGESTANFQFLKDNLLASTKALYHGHAVAAVAAVDLHTAEDALALIEVQYEPLPHVVDVREAMLDSAPVLHDSLRTQIRAAGIAPRPDRPTNVASHMRLQKGEIEKGFAEADVVIEREFETSMFHQGYIEPHTSTAYWNKDGEVSIWTSSQGPFGVRGQVAALLQLPVSKVHVTPMEIGGGFGGKIPTYLDPITALLSRKSGRPVKVAMTREAVFEGTGPTSATFSRVKIGAKKDGTLTAAQVYLAYGAGAFPGSSVGAGAMCALAPYVIPNTQIDGLDVVVNRPKTEAYRAPGAPAAEFGVEAVMNELAERLDIDPLELRLKNIASEGALNASGQPWGKIGAREVVMAMKEHQHYNSELQGEHVGRGVALGFWFNGGMESASSAKTNDDGTVSLILGSVDIGGSRASLAMQLAETLGVPYEAVKPKVVDTDSVGFTMVTGGSRTTFAGGWVAYELGVQIRGKLVERAARIWEVPVDQVSYGDDGVIRGPKDAEGKERKLAFTEIAGQLARTGGQIAVSASVSKNTQGAAFAGHIVDLKVDTATGKVDVLRYTAVQDVGTAIHPSYVEGQIHGAVAQGIGMALLEEYVYGADGRLQNASFLDYRMPTTLDVPMIETVLVEVPNPGHPYGVRGVGEVPIVPPQGAIQAAVYDAIGVRFQHTPMSPRVILDELLPDGG